MKWNILYRDTTFGHPYLKPHVVSEELTDAIIDSFLARGVPNIQWKAITSCILDLRGPALPDEYYHDFDLDDLEIKIPSSNMIYFFDEIQELENREDIDALYYKIHAGYIALCLNPDQKDALLIQMSSELRKAECLVKLHYEARRQREKEREMMGTNVVSFEEFKKRKAGQ